MSVTSSRLTNRHREQAHSYNGFAVNIDFEYGTASVGASLLANKPCGSPQQLDTGNMTALPAAHVLRLAE
ncbi:hypothetical protein LIS66_13475 [Pseudomonas sp. HN2]|uniref:hypothetical protein n=1 Tax=Pseudomonas sp. HN2 TaxID=2884805 RepID=UPI001D136853|nr:hypothetical protein [Pseudomonas sp. HN2]UEB93418.1 hypothetical protein LIS66_13475 [Pseudomonas sp. HN2]